MQTPSKRKGVGLMEVVSYGSPQTFFTRENQCHRVSPVARRQGDLKPHQVGIKRPLTQMFTQEMDLHSLVKEAVKEAVSKALAEEREKNLIYEDDVKRGLVTGITIRSLVSDWSRTSKGKEELQKMAEAVNRSYEEGVKGKTLPHNRKILHGDLMTELKHLTKTLEFDRTAKSFMEKASAAIQVSTKLCGDEFLQMVSGYVQANEQVHVKWTRKKLLHVLELAKQGDLQVDGSTPGSWIRHMVDNIAEANGWSISEGDL